jgi:hypothetical protein
VNSKYFYPILLVLLSGLLTTCGSDPNDLEGDSALMVLGVIESIDAGTPPLELLLWIGDVEADWDVGFDKLIVRVWASTSITIRRSDGSRTGGEPGDLEVGDSIRAWHRDAVSKSLPLQVDATRIEVTKSGTSQ